MNKSFDSVLMIRIETVVLIKMESIPNQYCCMMSK